MFRLFGTIADIFTLMKDPEVKLTKKLMFIFPVAYFLFPYDLIWDFFPVIGQIDDIAVFIIMWPFLKDILEKYNSDDKDVKKKSKEDSEAYDLKKDDYEVE
ncbi:YkvA family protein [Halanaerobium hydrogeniformans]|uniref:DUF1232 domain-containing protein n=1 Tax=Halanaerobium hydrogeniformans TaxID=656519 RepID=E4RJM9_HALHG|nr:DUF1232 domain-containing protein [Halanaerobium hydrogeniformans]ADQ15449.1 protein of unknown function DUF1232 [Halanaerobium hydrogeniformans]